MGVDVEIVLGEWGLELPSGEQAVKLKKYISGCIKHGRQFSGISPIERRVYVSVL